MADNLWILTEERPKLEVVRKILYEFTNDEKLTIRCSNFQLIPEIIDKKFTFRYIVSGIKIDQIENIFLKTVSGEGSFVDYLLYRSEKQPDPKINSPLYLIEETKTTPAESRDLFYQRLTKFVSISFHKSFVNSKKIMLFSMKKEIKEIPQSVIFSLRVLKTMNVKIIGFEKEIEYHPFVNIDDMAAFKNAFAKTGFKKDGTPAKDVPYRIDMDRKSMIAKISAKLMKPFTKSDKSKGESWSDPSQGFASGCAYLLRKFNWTGKIILVNHKFSSLSTNGDGNKFIQIANKLDLSFDGLNRPNAIWSDTYFQETKGEKLSSIFLHLSINYLNSGKIIYENHAGCEQGYFETTKNAPETYQTIEKVKTKKPDIIIIDETNSEILILESEMTINAKKGLEQLNKFTAMEQSYCEKFYPKYKHKKFVIVYGDTLPTLTTTQKDKIIFQLKTNGEMIYFDKCPELIKNMVDILKSNSL